jgi:large subunit ribosomal protein L15
LCQARLIGENIKDVKIILVGEITRVMTVKGLKIIKGAQAAVEVAGGKVEA